MYGGACLKLSAFKGQREKKRPAWQSLGLKHSLALVVLKGLCTKRPKKDQSRLFNTEIPKACPQESTSEGWDVGVQGGRGGSSGCRLVPIPQASPPPPAYQPFARAWTGRWVFSTAASTRCASTTSSRTSRPSPHRPWASRRAASPAACAGTACAEPWRRTAWCVSATRAGPARCATRRPATPALATGRCSAPSPLPRHPRPSRK